MRGAIIDHRGIGDDPFDLSPIDGRWDTAPCLSFGFQLEPFVRNTEIENQLAICEHSLVKVVGR